MPDVLSRFREKRGTGKEETYWSFGIEYRLCEALDGWWAIFRKNPSGIFEPVLEAADLPHAKSYCARTEPVPVPVMFLCEE